MELGFAKIDINNHFTDCMCASCGGSLSTSNEVVKVYRYALPINAYANQTMGDNIFEDLVTSIQRIFDSISNVAAFLTKVITDVIKAVTDFVGRALIAIGDALSKINWEGIGKFLGEALIWLNPVHIVWSFLTNFPLTSHLAKQLDELTGGTLSTLDRLSTLAGRALRGDAISKAELLQDALFCIKVAVAVFTGPAGWVAFGAGQLKQGTLGRTALGRDILSIIEIAGYAYVAGTALYDAASDKATDIVMQNAQADMLRNVKTGDPYLDAFLVGATFAVGTTAYSGGSVYDSFLGFSGKFAENTAITELAGRIGGPLGKDIAKGVVKGIKDGEVDPSQFDYTKVPSGYSLTQFVDDMGKLGSSVKDSFLAFIQTDGGAFALPNFTIDLKMPDVHLPDLSSISLPSMPSVNLSMPSISSPKIEFPELTMPTFSWDLGDWSLGNGRARKRKTKVRGTNGKYYTVYLMDDGSLYYVQEYDYLKWIIAGGGALIIAASV